MPNRRQPRPRHLHNDIDGCGPAGRPSSSGENALLALVVIAFLALGAWAIRCSGEAEAGPPPLDTGVWGPGPECRLYPSGDGVIG